MVLLMVVVVSVDVGLVDVVIDSVVVIFPEGEIVVVTFEVPVGVFVVTVSVCSSPSVVEAIDVTVLDFGEDEELEV